MKFFDTVEMAPPDPILGLNAAFKADPRSNKVNLSIGAYKTDDLEPLVLAAVRKAEQQILTEDMDKEYLSQDGNPEYVQRSIRLVFDKEQDNIFGAQAPGGTAGVRLAGEFLAQIGSQVIYIPDPTWANHNQVFARAGLEVASYPYYDAERREFTKLRMIEAIKSIPSGSPILLHACCHNPTGLDPTPADWKETLHCHQRHKGCCQCLISPIKVLDAVLMKTQRQSATFSLMDIRCSSQTPIPKTLDFTESE